MTRTWQDNADEFGAIDRGEGGWSLAALVACSVTLQEKAGRPVSVSPETLTTESDKVGVNEFSSRARVSRSTVSRYLSGWTRAIENGADVPAAEDLWPADVGSFALPDRPFNGRGGFITTMGATFTTEAVARRFASDPEAMAAIVEAAEPEAIARIASHPKVAVEAARQRTPHRPIVDPAPPGPERPRQRSHEEPQQHPAAEAVGTIGDSIGFMKAANEADRAIIQLEAITRRGLFSQLDDSSKAEATRNIRRWTTSLEMMLILIEGQPVTDDSIASWLAS